MIETVAENQTAADVVEVAQEISPEQAADLAALAQSIADEPLPPEPQEPQDEAAPVATAAQVAEISGVLFTVGQIASMRFDSLKSIYQKKRCDEVAEAVAPVFADLGWNVTGGKVGMYLTAAVSVFMLGNDTRMAIRADIANQEAAAGAN